MASGQFCSKRWWLASALLCSSSAFWGDSDGVPPMMNHIGGCVKGETPNCPNDCSDQGQCDFTTCHCRCDAGWDSADCSHAVPICPNYCSGHGLCLNNTNITGCQCDPGWMGPSCDKVMVELSCPNRCSGRGRCINGKCQCEGFHTGPDCSMDACPNLCSMQGVCVNGTCKCGAGYGGHDCSFTFTPCPGLVGSTPCTGHGSCAGTGLCTCFDGWKGENCSIEIHPPKSCLHDCSLNGNCDTISGNCTCHEGYKGDDCSIDLSTDMNDNGKSEGGVEAALKMRKKRGSRKVSLDNFVPPPPPKVIRHTWKYYGMLYLVGFGSGLLFVVLLFSVGHLYLRVVDKKSGIDSLPFKDHIIKKEVGWQIQHVSHQMYGSRYEGFVTNNNSKDRWLRACVIS